MALKFNQTQIAQLLHSKGATETTGKIDTKDKKNKHRDKIKHFFKNS